MATTTTNFGWDIPQSTDLVKDGATAIAALGQDIDTAFIDLKGGTTGQVLSKASGTDLDFSWVAQDDSNAIQNAIVDAKGDLIAATAADTPARLAVGTNGQVLTADSTAATGLAWATPATSGGWTSIASGSLGTAPLTLSSISASYKDLRLVLRDYSITASAAMGLRFNNDSTSNNYNYSGTYQRTTSVTSFAALNSWVIMDSALNISPTDYRNTLVIDLYDYTNTTANKLGRTINGYVEATNTDYILEQNVFMWNNSTPAAVNRIDLVLTSGNFDGGTYILYGAN